jgi:hypothetical protein
MRGLRIVIVFGKEEVTREQKIWAGDGFHKHGSLTSRISEVTTGVGHSIWSLGGNKWKRIDLAGMICYVSCSK